MTKYKIEHWQDKNVLILNQKDLLKLVNENRSNNWKNYNRNNLRDESKVADALSLTDYELIKIIQGEKYCECADKLQKIKNILEGPDTDEYFVYGQILNVINEI